jgi:hypothetical protein
VKLRIALEQGGHPSVDARDELRQLVDQEHDLRGELRDDERAEKDDRGEEDQQRQEARRVALHAPPDEPFHRRGERDRHHRRKEQ